MMIDCEYSRGFCTLVLHSCISLRELGTSVHLKNKYAGYVVELIVKRESFQEIIDLVSTQLTGVCVCGYKYVLHTLINLSNYCRGYP